MADDRKIIIDIEAKDHASSTFRSVTSGLNRFVTTANNGIYRANNALRSYNNTMRGFNSTVQRALLDAGKAIYNFTTDAIKQFAELEKQHAKTMGAMSSNYNLNTPSGLQQFQANSRALMDQAIYIGYNGISGKGSLHSPQEISAAQTALVKAGVSEKDILNTSALTDVVKFAGANDLSLDTAVEFAVQLGTQFNYKPNEWGDMLDQVTYAANASIIDVEDIIESMKYAGNMASGYDQPLNEVLAAIAVMGQSGLKGTQAGTGIQAIFARGMSTSGVTTAGTPPTQNVEDVYNGFVSKVVDSEGNFMGLGNFASVLEQETSGLSDQETSWFYRKLFGMFQQKAGLALSGADEGEMSYDDYVNAIIENAAGTNDKVYEIALESTYGQLESVENAWTAFKTEFGQDLSPLTTGVATELRNALIEKDFDFDTDIFREKVEEAGTLLAEDFGQDVADAFTNVGDFLANAIDIGLAETPLVTGSLEALVKLLNGDFEGGWQTFKDGVEGVNENIDDLPPELQNTANAIRNLIIMFEGLFALNIVTRVSEGVTSILRLVTGNKVRSIRSSVTSASSTITAGAVTNMTTGAISNATVASMMANTNTMTVYANIVNVIGGGGGSGGSGGGTPSLPSGGGLPSLPIGGGTPSLPGGSLLLPGAAAAGGYAAGRIPSLPSGSGTPLLPGGTGAAAGAGAGAAVNLYWNPVTQSYTTAGALAKSIAIPALKIAGIAGMAYVGASIPEENQLKTAYQYGFGTDYADYLGEDYMSTSGLGFGGFLKELLGNGGHWYDDMRNVKVQNFMRDKVEPATPNEYREARDELFNAIDGLKDYDAGKQYLSGVLDRWYWENSGGDKEFITQDQYVGLAAALVEAMSQYMTDNNITEVSTNALGGPDAGGVPGLGTDIYQTVLDAMLAGLQGQDDASKEAMANAATDMSTASISLSDAVNMLIDNGSISALGLGLGPLSNQGAYDYIMGKFSTPAGIAANQELLSQINASVAAIDPNITVDITNPAPIVNVDVDVKVDKSGNVSQNIIKNYTGVDSWLYNYTKRTSGVGPLR